MTLLRAAVDIGGTFTDVQVLDTAAGAIWDHKTPTTPSDPAVGLAEGLQGAVAKRGMGVDAIGMILHGSTIAINTILERTGARTALVITEGFRDIYEIGRINRPDSYNLFFQKQ